VILGDRTDGPHLPYPASIDAYGKGGFRFAGMSHRGSLLCLPDGIWPWPVATTQALTEDSFELVFERAAAIDLFLLGTGRDLWVAPTALLGRFRRVSIKLETIPTAAAARTYNVLFAEGRRVAAGLIATD
jgi:uncharacterized protein